MASLASIRDTFYFTKCTVDELQLFVQARTGKKPSPLQGRYNLAKQLIELDKQVTFGFMDLAPELRVMVYYHVKHNTHTNNYRALYPFLLTCKILHQEAKPIMYDGCMVLGNVYLRTQTRKSATVEESRVTSAGFKWDRRFRAPHLKGTLSFNSARGPINFLNRNEITRLELYLVAETRKRIQEWQFCITPVSRTIFGACSGLKELNIELQGNNQVQWRPNLTSQDIEVLLEAPGKLQVSCMGVLVKNRNDLDKGLARC